jgi:hypothetical protein
MTDAFAFGLIELFHAFLPSSNPGLAPKETAQVLFFANRPKIPACGYGISPKMFNFYTRIEYGSLHVSANLAANPTNTWVRKWCKSQLRLRSGIRNLQQAICFFFELKSEQRLKRFSCV